MIAPTLFLRGGGGAKLANFSFFSLLEIGGNSSLQFFATPRKDLPATSDACKSGLMMMKRKKND